MVDSSMLPLTGPLLFYCFLLALHSCSGKSSQKSSQVSSSWYVKTLLAVARLWCVEEVIKTSFNKSSASERISSMLLSVFFWFLEHGAGGHGGILTALLWCAWWFFILDNDGTVNRVDGMAVMLGWLLVACSWWRSSHTKWTSRPAVVVAAPENTVASYYKYELASWFDD